MSSTYTIQRDDVIKAGLQLCLVLGQGDTPGTNDVNDSIPYLQSLLKFWEVKGYNAWLYTTINWAAVANKPSYTFGATGDIVGDRPVRMPQAWTQDASNNKTQLMPLSMQQFKMLTPPAAPGPSNSYLYDRQLGLGVFYPWPVPTDTSLTYYAITQRPMADLVASPTATFDIEQSWYLPLIWNFAEQIMAMYGVPEAQCARIERNAAKFLDEAASFTEEDASVFFQPNAQGGVRRGRG